MLRSFFVFPALFLSLLLSAGVMAATPEGAFLGVKQTQYPAWFKQSFLEFNEDLEEAAAENKRLLLLFHQPGCPYCAELVENNLAQPAIEKALKTHFDVVALNMWGDRELITVDDQSFTEKTFSELLKVQFTPTLLFFDEQGKVVLRLNGYVPPEEFSQALSYVSQHGEKQGSYRDFLKSVSNVSALKQPDAEALSVIDLQRHADARPLVVIFEQSKCQACDDLNDQVLATDALKGSLAKFEVVRLPMWSSQAVIDVSGKSTTAAKLAEELSIQYAPTMVLYNAQGSEVIRSEAYFKRFHTQSMFEYVLSGAYQQQPSFQRYISERAEHIREAGVDVNIWD